MTVLKVSGIVLPQREHRTFYLDGDRLRLDAVPGAHCVADKGFLLPGLVDVHTHPGAEQPSDPFDEGLLRRHLGEHRDAGVLLVRTPGTVARIPSWAHEAADLPRIMSGGRWLALQGMFFDDYDGHVTEQELVAAAVQEATSSSGWCKVVGDWREGQVVPLDLLAALTEAVHAAGGRVAVHAQTAQGCEHAVLAGVDTLEHGQSLDPGLLDTMAAQGTALVPTLIALSRTAERVRAAEPAPRRERWLRAFEAMFPMVRDAHDAGVTVLAGTDGFPCGRVTAEVEMLVRAGMPAEAAVGAASWQARSYLGLPGLADGAPADILVYDTDPTLDPDALRHPSHIILRGQVIKS